MGKAIITVRMSADAGIGPDIGRFAGHEQEAAAAAEDGLRLADAMRSGRTTHEALSAIWPKATGAFADRVNGTPTCVASTSLVEPLGWNASLIKGDLVAEVRRLKAHHAGHRLSDGCGEFAFNLVKHGLVDEVRVWVQPIVWSGPSRPVHGRGRGRMNLKGATLFRGGVILQNHEPVSVEELRAERRARDQPSAPSAAASAA
jgi:dihydrofolate reductase